MDWDDVPLSKKGLKKLYNDYDSMDLLQAVDALDKIRYITGDQEDYKPPQIRFDLMELHTQIFNLIRQGHSLNKDEREKLSDLVNGVEEEIDTIVDNAKIILKIIRPLVYDLFADYENEKDHATGLDDLEDEDWFKEDNDNGEGEDDIF